MRVLTWAATISLFSYATLVGAQSTNAPSPVQRRSVSTNTMTMVEATVISWDKAHFILMAEVAGKVQRWKVLPSVVTAITNVDGVAQEMSPGQEISIVFKGLSDGGKEIVSIVIKRNKSRIETTGTGGSGSPAAASSPFETFANPANTSGRVISPAR